MNFRDIPIAHKILLLLGCLPLAIWAFHYLTVDLWYDEVYSLEHYALTDLKTTLFYYPAPNNHIFFNLTTQFISRISGLRTVFEAAKHVYVFRTLQLLISLGTAYYCLNILKRHFSFKNHALVTILLFTTIPFLNFSLQLRGYNMSSLFGVMLLYYSWAYIDNGKGLARNMIVLSGFLLMYTIPANVYYLGGLWLIIGAIWAYAIWKKRREKAKRYFWTLVFISLGVVIATAFYLPIIEDVIFNEYSSKSYPGIFYTVGVFLEAIPAYLSGRYFLLPLVFFGGFLYFKQRETKESCYALLLLALFLLPFGIAFVHQKAPFPRVFVGLSPIFAMLLTVLVVKCIEGVTRPLFHKWLYWGVMVYCLFTFFFEVGRSDEQIIQNLKKNQAITQNLSANYYLSSSFTPDTTIQALGKIYEGAQVYDMDLLDWPSTRLYLRKYNIPYQSIEAIDEIEVLKGNDPIYVITSKREKVMKALESTQFTVTALTEEGSFLTLLKLE
ncbi:MAG: hypothetical protein Aureis2KO_29700 [Aureisphaera sp.]